MPMLAAIAPLGAVFSLSWLACALLAAGGGGGPAALGGGLGGAVDKPPLLELFSRFGTAAGLGLLVGLEREWAKSAGGPLFAGIRTFPSIALLGCASALVSELHGIPWFFGISFLSFTGLVGVSYLSKSSLPTHGMTTEITSLLVFMIGGLTFWQHFALATSLTVLVVLLLSLKEPLHDLARRIEAQDIYATLKFAIVSVIIMPLLPQEPLRVPSFPALEVLNPQKIWLIVVFVSGIGLMGYVAAKLLGARRGIVLTGLLGGLASSTAVAASMAQRSHESEPLAPQFALAALLASTVMFPRTIVEVLLVDRNLAVGVALPLLAAGLFGVLASAYLWFLGARADTEEIKLTNPFSLIPAIKFGALFATMLVVSKLAQQQFSSTGVYVVAAVGGLIDTRPVALSVASMVHSGEMPLAGAVPAVMIAALANTVLKGGYTAALGARRFRRLILPAYLVVVLGGVVAILAVLRYGDAFLAWLGIG